ncbi:MAG: tRNA lysidine(34) synthetase TilS [Rhodocyclaceae bacterium]|nr:tRNA lysidine(34) synthetase TilS [Rhodocyclaceae bacterium]MDZ4213903.1 tRNA lysidine(34) synthetase TilS [Rhodocyclaceae bacterium]
MPHTDSAAPLIKALAACFSRHIAPGSRVTLALSGGVDSMALLHACLEMQRAGQFEFTLDVVHVHHGLSPHADAWTAFCQERSAYYGLPCEVVRVEVERGSSDGLEGAARRARHAVFRDRDCDWLLLAHHQDDQAETMLFNLLRGSGLAGAAGMHECNGRLLRPWLDVTRAEIERYAQEKALTWIVDESNADERFSRNYLRARIFPVLRERFPAGPRNLARAAGHFSEARRLLDELACLDLGDAPQGFPLSLKCLKNLSEARARNLLRFLFSIRQVPIPSEARLSEAVQQLCEAGPDKHPVIRFGPYELVRRRDQVDLLTI